MTNFAVVAALCAETGAIGFENKLPWADRLGVDMSFFRLITTVPWSLSCNRNSDEYASTDDGPSVGKDFEPYSIYNKWNGIFEPTFCFPRNRFALDFEGFIYDQKPQNAMVMGRKTADSMQVSLPLAGRVNVILSNNVDQNRQVINSDLYKDEKGIFYSRSIQSICQNFGQLVPISNVLVIGGSEIYSQFIKFGLVDHLFLTFVFLANSSSLKGADVFFPSIPANYRVVENISHQVAKALLEWKGTPEGTKRLLTKQIDDGFIMNSGSIRESSGHLLKILWFQRISSNK